MHYRDAQCCATCKHCYIYSEDYEADDFYCAHPECQSIIDQYKKGCYGVPTKAWTVCDYFLSQGDA